MNLKKTTKSLIHIPDARVLAVTGAGISAESGIPTFRGKGGYWQNLDPTKLATQSAFDANPQLVWDWYRERRKLIRCSQPNAAHNALVKLAANSREFLLLTQNVDDLHARAQYEGHQLPPEEIVQIHGDIFVTRCSHCDFRTRKTTEESGGVPACPRCGSPLRPGVIWFDEELEPYEADRVKSFLKKGECGLVLVIGTTASFDYIVNWALAAKGQKGQLIEINPEETAFSKFADEVIRQQAAVALPNLVRRLIERKTGQTVTLPSTAA
jgi:NAD-dependent deacetylase